MSIDLRPGAAALESPKAVPGAETVASHWLAVSSALTQTQAVQNASIPPEAWTGAAADAASNEIQVLGHKLADLAEVFPDPAQGLKTWKSQVDQAIQVISGLQQQWDEAVATYNKAIAAISSRRMTEDNFHPEIEEKKARATLEGAQRPLKKSYEDQLHQLNEAASQKADSIKAAADSKISPEAVKRGRDAVGAELLGTDMPIADGAASWAQALADSPQMMADVEEAANSKGALSEEDIKRLEEKWGDKFRNPYYVQAMADLYRSRHSGKGDYSDLLNRLAVNIAGTATAEQGAAETRNAFISRIGTAMVLSTGGVDASEHHLADSAVYEQVKSALRGRDGVTTIAQIERANIESFKETSNVEYSRHAGGFGFRGMQVFTQATAAAGIQNPDLTFGPEVYEGGKESLAAKIVEYDHGVMPTQNLPSREQHYYSASLLQETKNDHRTRLLVEDPLQSLYQLSDTPETLKNEGAPASMRSAEILRLSRLRDFLNTDTTYSVGLSSNYLPVSGSNGPMTFARYLTGHRHPESVVQVGELDAGEALGDMLHDASDPHGLGASEPKRDQFENDESAYIRAHNRWRDESRTRASIAANTMAGYQDGLDYQHKTGFVDRDSIDGQDVFGYRNHALRSWMGSIISPYASDLADQMENSHDSGQGAWWVNDGNNRAQMRFNGDLVARFKAKGGLLQDLAFDQPQRTDEGDPSNPLDDKYEGGRRPALQALQIAAYTGYMDEVHQSLQHADPANRTTGVTKAISHWAELIQEVYDAHADKEDALNRALDSSHAAARKTVALLLDLGGPIIPGGPIASTGTKAVVGSIAEVMYGPSDDADKIWKRHQTQGNAAMDLMAKGLVRELYNSDYWSEGGKDVSPDTRALAGRGYLFVDESGRLKPYKDLDSAALDELFNYFRGSKGEVSDFAELFSRLKTDNRLSVQNG